MKWHDPKKYLPTDYGLERTDYVAAYSAEFGEIITTQNDFTSDIVVGWCPIP